MHLQAQFWGLNKSISSSSESEIIALSPKLSSFPTNCECNKRIKQGNQTWLSGITFLAFVRAPNWVLVNSWTASPKAWLMFLPFPLLRGAASINLFTVSVLYLAPDFTSSGNVKAVWLRSPYVTMAMWVPCGEMSKAPTMDLTNERIWFQFAPFDESTMKTISRTCPRP